MIIWYLFTRFDKNSKHDSQNWRTLEFLNDAKNNRSPDRMWIISWILAKSNQKGHCINKNYGKIKLTTQDYKCFENSPISKIQGIVSLLSCLLCLLLSHNQSNFTFLSTLKKNIFSFLKNKIFSHKNVSLLFRK